MKEMIMNIHKCFSSTTALIMVIFSSLSCSEDTGSIDNTIRTSTVNIEISDIKVSSSNSNDKFRMISFDISWGNNWNTSNSADSRDAAWVFIKYKTGDGEWKHATLSAISTEHVVPAGVTINSSADGKGIYFIRSDSGNEYYSVKDVSLKWNYGEDDLADNAEVSLRVFGLEMVYIPEGAFYAGDNGTSYASLIKGSEDNRPWYINNEDAIEVTDALTDGFYYKSSKEYWSEQWNASEDMTGSSFTIPADFPKGFRAIYCMKYELTQQQYVDFLNTLTGAQAANRYGLSNYNHYGYSIKETAGIYSTDHPDRACGFLSPADGFAYADWAGLRPMSELEFEKICRGGNKLPLNGEYAWGSTYCKNARGVTGSENDRQQITSAGANSYFSEDNYSPEFPLNCGIFFEAGKSGELFGATYYGVMEMSGNLNETCVSIGNQYGRVFTFQNGDGELSPEGFTNETNWPLRDGKGAGYKGGNFAREMHEMRVSERLDATVEIDSDHRHIPLGFRGVRSVSL